MQPVDCNDASPRTPVAILCPCSLTGSLCCVQAFLEANNLKLIIRSHEGPDARWKREGMQDMNKGHSLDHVTPGKPVNLLLAMPLSANYCCLCFRLMFT